jgi:hypothetical protein
MFWSQIPKEGDHEARNTLDTVFLNQLGTQPQDDISKNDLDTGEQEEGMGQPEIDIPTTELSANIDPSPTSPSRIKTSCQPTRRKLEGQVTRTYRKFPC